MAPNGHHNADIILCWMFGKKRRARVDHLDQDTSNDVLSRFLSLTWMGFIPTDSHGGWVGGKCGVTAAERLLINSCTIFALWVPGHLGINMLVNLWAFTIWPAQRGQKCLYRVATNYSMHGLRLVEPSNSHAGHLIWHPTCSAAGPRLQQIGLWVGGVMSRPQGCEHWKINQNPRSRTGRLVQSWGPRGHVDGSAIPVP